MVKQNGAAEPNPLSNGPPAETLEERSAMFDKIYGGIRGGDKDSPPWMNCGWVDPEWSDEKVKSVVDEFINEAHAGGDSKYGGTCTALATQMYGAIPVPDVESSDGKGVLDVGCGYGAQAVLFRKLHPNTKYTGVNISSVQIEAGKKFTKSLPNVELKVADATDLSQFSDASFTNVYALECAFHFNTRLDFLKEAARVLNDGGAYAATDCIPKGWLRKPPKGEKRSKEDQENLRKALKMIRQEVGVMWLIYFITNALICGMLYGQDSWPANKEVSSETYEESLREAGFTGELSVTDISERVFFYNNIYRYRILGLDKNCLCRWLSPYGWWMCIYYFLTEWSANPFLLAILCRKELSPYILVSAHK